MTTTNVELYEALKPTVGEAAAKMIAEVVPPTRDLATKGDVDRHEAATSTRFAEVHSDLTQKIDEVRSDLTQKIDGVRSDLTQKIEGVRSDLTREIEVLRGETRTGFAQMEGRIHAEGTRTIKWLLGFFVPVWAGTWGTVVAVLLKA